MLAFELAIQRKYEQLASILNETNCNDNEIGQPLLNQLITDSAPVELVAQVLALGANPLTPGRYGITAVDLAMHTPSPAYAAVLAAACPKALTQQLRNDLYPLEMAVDQNLPDHYAAITAHVEPRSAESARAAQRWAPSPPEDTPFWLAANNDAPMLAAELAGGLNPNTKTENGMTLLHWACAGDAPECVQLLLDAGADVCALDAAYQTPLVHCRSSLVVDHLFCYSPAPYTPSTLPPHLAPSPLRLVTGAGRQDVAAALIRHYVFDSSDVNMVFQRGDAELLAAMVEAGVREVRGRPLLEAAILARNRDVFMTLLELFVDLDIRFDGSAFERLINERGDAEFWPDEVIDEWLAVIHR